MEHHNHIDTHENATRKTHQQGILNHDHHTMMEQNLVWASGYNAIAIPVAAGILMPWEITFRPEWGALIMSASSIIVTNAILLRNERLS
ncbi:MAG: hypothetical protein NWE89_05650 [Candidatus Bathyarchaeota archaeon]|nr:hypothetical protein [Candidatus Bathyarchaeota archaeon]